MRGPRLAKAGDYDRFRYVEDLRVQALFNCIPLPVGHAEIDPIQCLDQFPRLYVELRATGAHQQFALKLSLLGNVLAIDDELGDTFAKFFAVMHSATP